MVEPKVGDTGRKEPTMESTERHPSSFRYDHRTMDGWLTLMGINRERRRPEPFGPRYVLSAI